MEQVRFKPTLPSQNGWRRKATYAHEHGVESRSAAVQKAIGVLRASELGDAYELAWQEWEESGEAELWEPTAADALPRA